MALSAEQQSALLKAYQQGIASGMTKEQATANVKNYLVSSGQYDSAKAAYQSPAQPQATPVQPQPSQAQAAPVAPKASTAQAPAPTPAQSPAPAPAPSAQYAPAPVTPSPKPSAPATPRATAAVSDAVVTPERASQINANLTEGAKNAKQNFTDVNAFKAAYGYDQKPEGERKILDSFWSKYAESNAIKPTPTPAPVVQTKDAMVTAIWNNQETPEMKASPEYQGLKYAADKARKFAGMSADELASSITNSQITDAHAAVISKLDPSFAEKWNAAKAQYKLSVDTGTTNGYAASLANEALGAEVGENGTTPASYEDPIISAIQKQIEAISTASAITQAEKDAQAEVNAKKAKIDELTASRDKIYEDIVATHPGLPKSLTMAMAAEKAKPLNEQISTLTSEANLALGQYNAAVEARKTSGDTAKDVATLNLEVAKRYAEVQEARAKALQESLAAKKLDTKVETLNINGKPTKVLIDMQTGNPIADLGPDVSSTKYQLTDYMGMKMAYDSATGTMKPVITDIQGNPDMEQKLNKDYASDTVVKGFDVTKQAYSRVMQAVSDSLSGKGNGIKDISVMYDFIKGLDPTSVVRESELELMNKANSIWGKITTNVENLKNGRTLNDTILLQVADQMQQFYDIAKTEVAKKQAGYIRRAGDVKARVDRVIDGDIYANYSPNRAKSYLESGSPVSYAKNLID